MLLLMCRKYIGMNAASKATGNVKIGMSAERKWNRKMIVTKLTITHSASKSRCSVRMDSLIRPDRSYPAWISTPEGRLGAISATLALIPLITFRAFSPVRITIMPPTASPSPCHSATPSRISGPKVTVPRSRNKTGVPFLELTDTSSRSFREVRYPRPLTM